MDTEAANPAIPESALEHRIEFVSHWVDKWTIPNPFVSLFYKSLAAWDLTLADFAFRQDSKNVAETALIVTIPRLRSSILLGLDHMTFRSANPDWELAPALVNLFDAVRTTLEEYVKIPVRSQESTLALHVTPGLNDFGKQTAKFIRKDIVGPAHFYGLYTHGDGVSLLLEKSQKYEGGAFFRLTREFPSSARFADVALALFADETAALALIGVKDLI